MSDVEHLFMCLLTICMSSQRTKHPFSLERKKKKKKLFFPMHGICFSGSGKVFVTQLCLTLCNPMDCSLPDSSVHGILQAYYWVWYTGVGCHSFLQGMEEILRNSPGNSPVTRRNSAGNSFLPDPRIEPGSSALQVHSLPSESPGKPFLG